MPFTVEGSTQRENGRLSFSYHMFHCAAMSQDEGIGQVWRLWRVETATTIKLQLVATRGKVPCGKVPCRTQDSKMNHSRLTRGSLHNVSLRFHYNLFRCSFKQLPAALVTASWLHTMYFVTPLKFVLCQPPDQPQ